MRWKLSLVSYIQEWPEEVDHNRGAFHYITTTYLLQRNFFLVNDMLLSGDRKSVV